MTQQEKILLRSKVLVLLEDLAQDHYKEWYKGVREYNDKMGYLSPGQKKIVMKACQFLFE